MNKVCFLFAGLMVLSADHWAQSLENLNASFDGEKLIVTYSLNYADANQKFKVVLFSSHDNYSQPIFATGDAGENVLPGKVKRAVWNAKDVLPIDFDGEVLIKIKATRVAAPKLTFAPLAITTYKRGNTVSMKWSGGYRTDKIHIELIKDNKVNLLVVDQINNTAAYEWEMPKKVKGRNYTLRVSNAAKPNELTESIPFTVKPRIPFLVKVIPIAAVGAAVAILKGGGTTPDEVLPRPLKPN